MKQRTSLAMALALCAAAGCTDAGSSAGGDAAPAAPAATFALDPTALATTPASLLVLAPNAAPATRDAVERALDRLGGGVLESLPPRLIVAQVPTGADAVLTDLGVVARFDRAVTKLDIAGLTLDEDRFLEVYANRWWPQQTGTKIVLRHAVRAPGTPFEVPPTASPARHADAAGTGGATSVAFASGTIVVSIVLPESNGVAEPSLEDWTEEDILATYAKVQTALDNLVAAEPNSHLRFIINYESRPGHGGLPGTVDSDIEFGPHAQFTDPTTESAAIAGLLATLLGHPVDPNDVTSAGLEYDDALAARYHADAAFFVIVAPDTDGRGYLRAHARINGPWFVIASSYGWDTFNHEMGHIMGAIDEYCPDACNPATSLQGYLGIGNANAEIRPGADGIDNGQGERQPNLMMYNTATAFGAYTRGAWGWLDADGDGLFDVLATTPRSQLAVTASGRTVRAAGSVTDVAVFSDSPFTPSYSVNRVVALEYRLDHEATWYRVPLAADVRGEQDVDVALADVTNGAHTVWIRAVNSVGAREAAQSYPVTVHAVALDAAPHVRLDLDRTIASTTATVTVRATAADPDGDALQYRFDLDGDGAYETAWTSSATGTFVPGRAGLIHVGVQVRDSRLALRNQGTASATADLYVLGRDAAPTVALPTLPSHVYGSGTAGYPLSLTAAAADPEGGPVQYRWLVDDATSNYNRHTATAWSSSPGFATTLATESDLAWSPLDLTAGDASLSADVREVIALDANTLAVAGDWRGVWFVDITDRQNPVVISHLDLETTAAHLYRDGSRLWVLGTLLTAVDISDLRAPRELPRLTATSATYTNGAEVDEDIGDGGVGQVDLTPDIGAKISRATIAVTIDHPQPSDLVISLYPPRELGIDPIVLADHPRAAAGVTTLTFTPTDTPALALLNGHLLAGDWSIVVQDDTVDGVTGRLVSATITAQTSSKATKVLDGADQLIGVGTNQLAVIGDGVQTFGTAAVQLPIAEATLDGYDGDHAFLLGSRLVWVGALTNRDGTTGAATLLRGLAVIDVSRPRAPTIVRNGIDAGGEPRDVAQIGSRMYVTMAPVCSTKGCTGSTAPYTIVGNAQAFASGGSAWQLGTTPLLFGAGAFGDDRTVTTLDTTGAVGLYDVHAPAAIVQTAQYPRSIGAALVPLAGGEVVVWQWGPSALVVHLDRVSSYLSRVYRVTVEARDHAGNVSRAARTVSVIPYVVAPTASIAATAGATTDDIWTFHVAGSSPTIGLPWNEELYARVDWNGDGIWDSSWFSFDSREGFATDIEQVFPQAGHYNVVVQVRDGFWAQATAAVAIDVK